MRLRESQTPGSKESASTATGVCGRGARAARHRERGARLPGVVGVLHHFGSLAAHALSPHPPHPPRQRSTRIAETCRQFIRAISQAKRAGPQSSRGCFWFRSSRPGQPQWLDLPSTQGRCPADGRREAVAPAADDARHGPDREAPQPPVQERPIPARTWPRLTTAAAPPPSAQDHPDSVLPARALTAGAARALLPASQTATLIIEASIFDMTS
jgi:hypothetical protein